jgi:hypothetical protein
MKRGFGGLAGQIRGNALGLFVVVLLQVPGLSSVLCIAPGSHVAIEDITALCCVSSAISLPSSNHSDNGFDRPGSCKNCTDLFLASNGSGILPQSGNLRTAGPFDAECMEPCLSSDTSVLQGRSVKIWSTDVPISACSSLPLRC